MNKRKLVSIFVLFTFILIVYMFFLIKTNQFAWHNNIQIARHSIDYVLGFISFTIFISLLLKSKKILLKVTAYIFIFILYINELLSMSAWLLNKSRFTNEMAYSILNTNMDEAKSFSTTMLLPVIISILFITAFVYILSISFPK